MTGDLETDVVQQKREWCSRKWGWAEWELSPCLGSVNNYMCDLGFTPLETIFHYYITLYYIIFDRSFHLASIDLSAVEEEEANGFLKHKCQGIE